MCVIRFFIPAQCHCYLINYAQFCLDRIRQRQDASPTSRAAFSRPDIVRPTELFFLLTFGLWIVLSTVSGLAEQICEWRLDGYIKRSANKKCFWTEQKRTKQKTQRASAHELWLFPDCQIFHSNRTQNICTLFAWWDVDNVFSAFLHGKHSSWRGHWFEDRRADQVGLPAAHPRLTSCHI